MSKKPEQKTYKVLKNIVGNNEAEALKRAEEKLQTFSRNLRANHTDKTFVFEKIR